MILGTLYLVFKDQATGNLKFSVMVCQYTESSFIGTPTRERIIAAVALFGKSFRKKLTSQTRDRQEHASNARPLDPRHESTVSCPFSTAFQARQRCPSKQSAGQNSSIHYSHEENSESRKPSQGFCETPK